MLFVQRWINQIPPDLPLWIQTSINKIVPITSPQFYSLDDLGSGTSNCKFMNNIILSKEHVFCNVIIKVGLLQFTYRIPFELCVYLDILGLR